MGKPSGPRKDRKKLSWTYRNKKRQGKTKKPKKESDVNVQVQNNKARIIARNLSFKITEDDLRNLYKAFGEIEQIDLLRRPDGKPVGCAFIQFKRIEDASKAIFQTHKQDFMERPMNVSWAIAKSKYVQQLNATTSVKSEENSEAPGDIESVDKPKELDIIPIDHENPDRYQSQRPKKERKKATPDDRKQHKLLKRQKRSRLIVRNLPFAVSEEDLTNHFSEYGTIEEVQILTKPDGKRVGCGFVQFDNVQSAAKALHYLNLQPLMGRSIVVDWAVPKRMFKHANKIEAESSEPDDGVCVLDEKEVKPKVEGIDEEKEEEEEEEQEDEEEEEEDEEDQEEEEDEEEESKPIKSEPGNRPRIISHDANEGKTVFLKNLPFSVKNDQLKECMLQFGPIEYALVCMDPLTEHSKGTAFVKFKNLEDAEKCLNSGTELQIDGQVLDPHRALDKQDILDSKFQKSKRATDSRNLYLVKEGVILAGSPAATDVSASDMAKRLQMEQWKSQMLRNLNMFVARVRLVVHNLPETMDDAKLRAIFKKHAGEKSVITEARVMRDLRNMDGKGVGKSKEFGFVAFTKHDDALRALRNINNNPNIFSKGKRPIVAFSIENRVMVNAIKRRIQKSRDNNPLWKGARKGETREESSGEPDAKRSKHSVNKHNSDTEKGEVKKEKRSSERLETSGNVGIPEFSGITSKPGNREMRSKFKLKSQAQLHAKIQKNEKKERKMKRRFKEQKIMEKNSRREIKPKQGMKKLSKDEANLDRMVENYKCRLAKIGEDKKKWYDA